MVSPKGPELLVVRPEPMAELTALLDDVVTTTPRLARARDKLLLPLRSLEAMAMEAPGALGDDVLAQERLRLLVLASDSSELDTSSFLASSGVFSGDLSVVAPTSVPDSALHVTPCAGGLLDLGALVIVGLAAGRVGLGVGLDQPFIRRVLGLAVAVGPAEAVARSIEGGMAPSQIAVLLSIYDNLESGQGLISALLKIFQADECEARRWTCLAALFAAISADIAGNAWDAADSGSIVSIEPGSACPGESIEIRMAPVSDDPVIEFAALGDGFSFTSPAGGHFLPSLAEGDAWVLFASRARATERRRPSRVDLEKLTVEVKTPADGQVGWIGFVNDHTLSQVNKSRTMVRGAWLSRNSEFGCLADSPVPTELIADLPDSPTPPRSPSGRFAAGLPAIVEFAADPPEVEIGSEFELRWTTEGTADGTVEVQPSPGIVKASGRQKVVAPSDTAILEYSLIATNACGDQLEGAVVRVKARISQLIMPGPHVSGLPMDVTVDIEPHDAQGTAELTAGDWAGQLDFDSGAVTFIIPAGTVRDGLSGTIRLLSPAGTVDDERAFGPVGMVGTADRTVVVVRPAYVRASPVGDDATSQIARVPVFATSARFGRSVDARRASIDIVEPAWIDDADITLRSAADGPEAPGTIALLERLNVLAARSPGLEDALWLALVPARDEGGFHRLEPGDGARAIAVSTPDHVRDVLAVPLPELKPRTERLRVIGTIDLDGSVTLESLQLEERRAGPGASLTTGLQSVGRSVHAEHVKREIRVVSEVRPARFVALVPSPPEVDILDIESGSSILGTSRVRRHKSPGTPRLGAVEFRAGGRVSWDYEHSMRARSSFTVEVSRNGGWSPVARAGHCSTCTDLTLKHIAPSGEPGLLRVVASDGWNATEVLADDRQFTPTKSPGALARYAGNRTFWADLSHPGSEEDPDRITWTLGRKTRRGPVLHVPEDFSGEIRLSAPGHLDDVRTIDEDGVVDPRGLDWSPR